MADIEDEMAVDNKADKGVLSDENESKATHAQEAKMTDHGHLEVGVE